MSGNKRILVVDDSETNLFLIQAIFDSDPDIKVELENVLGPLTPLYIPPSNFLVKPYVAWLSARPLFSIDPKEVNSLLIFPVSDLAEESNWRNYTVNGVGVPGIKFGKHLVWGATAMMLREFIDTFAK